MVIKRRLVEALNTLLEPIRQRRKQYEASPDHVLDVLAAEPVVRMSLPRKRCTGKAEMKQDYFTRKLSIE